MTGASRIDPAAAIAVASVAVAVAAAIALRPLLPVDETRYMTVAWEMWSRGSIFVPYLNGETYAHKPPLFFWLIHLAWSVGGVSETAARLVPGALALGTLAATGWIARRLWPDDARARTAAVVMLTGMPVFMAFATMVMFDMLLAFCTTMATAAVVALATGATRRWWAIYAVCFGAAILAKGPVGLLFLLPAPLFAPWWWPAAAAPDWRRWYGCMGLAAAGGLAVVLVWLVPAIVIGGEDYAGRILWRQTAERVGGSLGHPRHWWFYLAVMPVILYPWGWIPSVWRGGAARLRGDAGLRLSLCVTLAPAVILSLVHGKQLHYLIPALPFLALMLARGLSGLGGSWRRIDTLLPLAVPVLVGLLMLASPLILKASGRPAPVWLYGLSPLWGLALLGAAVVPVAYASLRRRWQLEGLAVAVLGIFVAVHLAGNAAAFDRYNFGQIAAYLRAHPDAPIAVNRPYHGEFGFLARLTRPVPHVDKQKLPDWIARHPRGLVVYRYRGAPPFPKLRPAVDHAYRSHHIGVWDFGAAGALPPGANVP